MVKEQRKSFTPRPPFFFFCSSVGTSAETVFLSGNYSSKNYSKRERLDLRLQHIWRLRVISSCL